MAHSFSSILGVVNKLQQLRENDWYERLYKVTVIIKGLDGLVELLAGLLLIVAPRFLHYVLQNLSGEALEHHGRFMRCVAENIAHIDADFARGGLIVVVLFLVTHGVVKLTLVWALLRKVLWAYPYALGVLVLFFLYQLYLLIAHPTVGMALFTLIDALIIYVVWGEWQKLNQDALAR